MMDIRNEIVKVIAEPALIKKSDGRTCLEVLVQSERFFRTKKGKQVKHTQFPMRCFGSRHGLDESIKQIDIGSELLVSGNLDQHYKDSRPTTVIVINNMDNLRVLDRGAA